MNPDEIVDEIKESKFVLEALMLNTLSKLTTNDAKRFEDLIRDVFLGINIATDSFQNEDFKNNIISMQCFEKLGIIQNDKQVSRNIFC